MKQKFDTRGLLTALVAWLLSLLLILTVLLGVVICTVCNRQYMKSRIIESGYHQSLWSQLDENYKSYGSAGGIPESVMGSIITPDQVQQDLFAAVDQLYAGERGFVEHPEVEQTAMQAITANLQQRDIQMTDEIQAAIQDLADGCQQDYENYVRIPLASMIAPYLVKVSGYVWLGLGVMAFLALAALLVLLQLQRLAPARLRWCIYSFSAAAVFCALVPVVANSTLHMERLQVDPPILRGLIGTYADGMFTAFFYFALIYAVIVAVLAVAWAAGRKRFKAAMRQAAYQQSEEEF